MDQKQVQEAMEQLDGHNTPRPLIDHINHLSHQYHLWGQVYQNAVTLYQEKPTNKHEEGYKTADFVVKVYRGQRDRLLEIGLLYQKDKAEARREFDLFVFGAQHMHAFHREEVKKQFVQEQAKLLAQVLEEWK